MSGVDLIRPIYLNWDMSGLGFGQLYFYQDSSGNIFCDNEFVSKEIVKEIFNLLVDKSIFNDIKSPQMDMYKDL